MVPSLLAERIKIELNRSLCISGMCSFPSRLLLPLTPLAKWQTHLLVEVAFGGLGIHLPITMSFKIWPGDLAAEESPESLLETQASAPPQTCEPESAFCQNGWVVSVHIKFETWIRYSAVSLVRMRAPGWQWDWCPTESYLCLVSGASQSHRIGVSYGFMEKSMQKHSQSLFSIRPDLSQVPPTMHAQIRSPTSSLQNPRGSKLGLLISF